MDNCDIFMSATRARASYREALGYKKRKGESCDGSTHYIPVGDKNKRGGLGGQYHLQFLHLSLLLIPPNRQTRSPPGGLGGGIFDFSNALWCLGLGLIGKTKVSMGAMRTSLSFGSPKHGRKVNIIKPPKSIVRDRICLSCCNNQ